eukprot:44438-Amphidinium_carterae.1
MLASTSARTGKEDDEVAETCDVALTTAGTLAMMSHGSACCTFLVLEAMRMSRKSWLAMPAFYKIGAN